MIRAVFDTNIFFQGILVEKGPAGECIKLVNDEEIRLFVTDQTFDEIRDVISRPRLIQKYPILASTRAEIVLRSVAAQAIFITDIPEVFKLDRDNDDEVFINLAIIAKADYLVSRDNDLLDLRHDSVFISSFPDLRIVSPVEFLQAVRAK